MKKRKKKKKKTKELKKSLYNQKLVKEFNLRNTLNKSSVYRTFNT